MESTATHEELDTYDYMQHMYMKFTGKIFMIANSGEHKLLENVGVVSLRRSGKESMSYFKLSCS